MMTALASNVTAQVYPGSGDVLEATSGQSNTNAATAGLFYEDRDFYLSTTDIGSLTKNLIFVNLFAPKILGGDAEGGINGNDRIGGFAYSPYFDAGTGFFAGSWWVGLAFNYGITEYKYEQDYASKTYVIAGDGTETSSTTAENATGLDDGNPATTHDWYVNDGFKLVVIFGNKTWGVKNDLQVVTSREEGYLTGVSLSGLGLTLPAGVTPASVPGGTQTVQPGSGVTKNEYTRGVTNNAYLNDTITFGINLGGVIAAAANISPWASLKLDLGYANQNSRSGYGWVYESSDALAGTKTSASYAEDHAAAVFNLGFGLSGGATFKINDVFSFSPELGYGIAFPIYGNKYTDIGGGVATAKGRATTQFGSTFEHKGVYLAPVSEKTGPITERVESWYADVSEISAVSQNLAPGFKLNAEFPRVSFALKYTPSFAFYNRDTVSKVSSKTVTTYKHGKDDSQSFTETVTVVNEDQPSEYNEVTWTNTINVGAQIWLKEDKFRLNLGSTFANQAGNWTTQKQNSNDRIVTTTTKTYDDGHPAADTQTQTTVSGSSSSSNQFFQQIAEIAPVAYNVGFTFFLNENVNFDFLLNSQEDRGENWLELLLPAAWALQLNIRY
jgi:hypothetical protein